MSIKAAFLLSLLLTSGFEPVDAKRLDRDKLKQIKYGLGDESAAKEAAGKVEDLKKDTTEREEEAAKQAAVTVEEKGIIEDGDGEAAEQAAVMVEEKGTIEDRNEDAVGSALAQVKPAYLNDATGLTFPLSINPQVHASGSAPPSGGSLPGHAGRMHVGGHAGLVKFPRSLVQALRGGAGSEEREKSIFGTSEEHEFVFGTSEEQEALSRREQHKWDANASKMLGLVAAGTIVGWTVLNWDDPVARAVAGAAAVAGVALATKNMNMDNAQQQIAKLERQRQVAIVSRDLDKEKSLELEINSLAKIAELEKQRQFTSATLADIGQLKRTRALALAEIDLVINGLKSQLKNDLDKETNLELEIQRLAQAKTNHERRANAAKQAQELESAAKSAAMQEEGRANKVKTP